MGSSSSSPLPPGPGKVRVQTDWSAKIQYMQRKQVPVSLSMAFQKGSGPATFRESGWITSSFSPSPTGLGELSLYQFPCISGCSHPSQSWLLFLFSSSFCSSFGPWSAQFGVPIWVSICIAIQRRMKVSCALAFIAHDLFPSASHLDLGS